MEEYVELGLEGVEAMIEHGFHKVPDRVLHIHNPTKKQRKQKERERREHEAKGLDESDKDEPPYSLENNDDQYRNGGRSRDSHQPYRSSRESSRRDATPRAPYQARQLNAYENPRTLARRDPLVQPDRYIPAAVMAGTAAAAAVQPPPADPRYSCQPRNAYTEPKSYDCYSRRPSDEYEEYTHSQEPPTPSRSRSAYERTRADSPSPPPSSSSSASARSRRSASRSRRPKSSRINDLFSSSDYGLGALSLGALAGGYAAYKAGKKKNVDPVLAVLAGGAVGGLGANAAEKLRENHKREKEGQKRRRKERYSSLDRDRDRDDRRWNDSY